MFNLSFQIIIFLMGCLCLKKAIFHMFFFWGVKEEIGRSMVFFMVEQVVSAACILVFSVFSLVTTLSPNSPLVSIDSEAAGFL